MCLKISLLSLYSFIQHAVNECLLCPRQSSMIFWDTSVNRIDKNSRYHKTCVLVRKKQFKNQTMNQPTNQLHRMLEGHKCPGKKKKSRKRG